MKNNILLGLFVTIGTLLFIVVAYYIGNRKNLFGERFHISAVFEDVKGLQVGNNVRYSGIDVGVVDKIVLLDDASVRVDMALEENVRPYVRKDAVARIGSDGLVGNIIVSISAGPGAGGVVKNHDHINSYQGRETDELIDGFGRTNDEIMLLTQNLIKITEQINSGSGTVGVLLRDSMLAAELRSSIAQLNQATRATRDLTYSLRSVLQGIEAGEGLAGGLLTDTIVMDHLRRSSLQIDTLLSAEVEPMLAELRTTGAALSAFSADLRQFSGQLQNDNGPIGALLTDSLMQDDLRRTLHNINEGTARFNENMEAMKHNFLFRRYFKKQEKQKEKNL